MDLATSLFGRAAGQFGNIKIDVIGRHHTTHRPAVFFINHQSTLIDALVTSNVVQRGFTVVAKAEVKQIPVLGQLLTLADVAFVDQPISNQCDCMSFAPYDQLYFSILEGRKRVFPFSALFTSNFVG